jgi:ArsR family transcriptional regulator
MTRTSKTDSRRAPWRGIGGDRQPAVPEGLSPEHDAAARLVRERMQSADLLAELAGLFKVLGDPTRVRILHALHHAGRGLADHPGPQPAGELCVCCIARILDMTPSAVSHQLRLLRAARLVKHRRDGKHIYYSLDDDHVHRLMAEATDHVTEERGRPVRDGNKD